MSGVKKTQAKLDSFFKPRPPTPRLSTSISSQSPTAFSPPSNFPHPAFGSSEAIVDPVASMDWKPVASQASKAIPDQGDCTSSLSPPPSSDSLQSPSSPRKAAIVRLPEVSQITSFDRVVKGSDDEDSDSDSSLVELATLLQSNHSSDVRPRSSLGGLTPSTPKTSRYSNGNLESKPSPIMITKYKLDLTDLAAVARDDDATEASSKRVKALSVPKQRNNEVLSRKADSNESCFPHHGLLESVVARREDGEMYKVNRALKRTEATLTEQRWYFFESQVKIEKVRRLPFPMRAVPEAWQKDFRNQQTRYHTFISGFVEDMVAYGNALPDEILLWIIDELCKEPNDALQNAYCNVLKESSEQVQRLITRDIVQNLFRDLGASQAAVALSQKIQPVQGLVSPYAKRDWGKLRSIVRFLGQMAKILQERVKIYVICMLLRMSVDRVVFDNVDLLDLVHETINRICRDIPDDTWEESCQGICRPLFDFVEQPTLRLQVVESVPSISPRTHDLRRRLAMSFYFNDISYSLQHSHLLFDLELFMRRLNDSAFNVTLETDFRELHALVLLLDIAVDDGRSMGLDLTNKSVERRFDKDVDEFAAFIRDIMKSIGTPGASYISKIEAKEALELVAQRIGDTLRSKPKPKQRMFDGPLGRAEEDLESEKAGIQSFLSKVSRENAA